MKVTAKKITAKDVTNEYLRELDLQIFLAVEAKESKKGTTKTFQGFGYTNVDYCLRDASEKIIGLAERCSTAQEAWAFLPALRGIYLSLTGEHAEWESECPSHIYDTMPRQLV